ncbi:MAG: beta-propeller fold lactonase family protein [Planctomycetes bacterium]|jgi:DNA-binding beta-propeller fold protein YncE|nr:beta-propeller fold lactonase family protein [Planctomycetota bacterium]
MLHLARSVVALLTTAIALSAQSFVNYESGPVAPLRLSPDATRLFVADTLGGRLCVFDLRDASAPFLWAEIPVGMEPVSVHPRSRDEVWVTNLLSDSVSIVDVAQGRVVDTLRVVDEPSDIVFAGGKAFVSAATRDEVHVFDAATRVPLGIVPIFGKDPRALAVSPDGSRVYALEQRSGNGTTILPFEVAPPTPGSGSLPTPPPQGLIVRADDPTWAAQIPYTLPDNDVAQIDVASLTVTRYFRAVGTINTCLAVHPQSGDLWIANTEARNLVRFEPNLRGHAIDSRLTRVTTGPQPTVTPFDLNVGMDYATLPNPAGRATALSEPFGVAIDAAAGLVYVAAHGTDRVGVVDLAGNVVARIEIGNTPGATVNTAAKRGPRALALHPSQPRLYLLNRLTDTLCVLDTTTRTVLSEAPIATVDPMPAAMRHGRKFLYDAKLSGNGTMSCAACHTDGDLDGIAWDLGDPTGSMQSPPSQPFPFNLGLVSFHPMKGPMTTQTLRGLQGSGVLHWRGDRADFQAFNGAFDKLMGGAQLSVADMNSYAAFANAIAYPPNPNQQLDRSYRTAPVGNNEAAGLAAFTQSIATVPIPGGASCATCHTLPRGTNGFVFNANLIQEPQQMKASQLRNMYRKLGFNRAPGPQKSGFGYTHDGALDSIGSFLARPVFNPWSTAVKDDLVTFLLSLDTGTAPAVGYQFVLDQANAGSAGPATAMALATARAAAGDLDVTAHGMLDGVPTGLLYQVATGSFVTDRTGSGPFTPAQLQTKAQLGAASLAFTAVPPGSGNRIGLDRDRDGTRNGDEQPVVYGSASPGCVGSLSLSANSEPRVGNLQFGYRVSQAPPNSLGLQVLALGQASIPVLGVTVLVDPATAVTSTIVSDAFGSANHPFAIPAEPANIGLLITAQALWLDACGSEFWSSSPGLRYTIRP